MASGPLTIKVSPKAVRPCFSPQKVLKKSIGEHPETTTLVPRQAPGYHASDNLTLTELDPAFSRNTNRYGPGAYFYEERRAAESHAASIKAGKIKYDHNPKPSRIYEGTVDLENVLDVDKIYNVAELRPIIDRVNQLRPGKLTDLPNQITGDDFYTRLTHAFMEPGKISLSRGVRGEVNPKTHANRALSESGVRTIIGRIPDPDTKELHRAFIVLTPIKVK